MEKEISELLQQIRQVENEHNQLVDEYFQMKDNVKQALTNLNNEPSSNHLNAYNYYLNLSESIMSNIRVKRLLLTNLMCELHKHGIFLNDEDEDEHEISNSSIDEGIDEQSLSLLDLSSKLSSLNNSENNNNNQNEDIF
ncbi:unnamed protein product [Adineta steineri]|uniref:Uncharacterized protein n=1 Tax=Adineta steineri TaxID=433720 RepID=A0A818ICU4_9BILA|nr:unnamed protein product [Adineta steineri]CAF1253349.1 unnamed protein product [Adineta steineri]CAF3524245.1 unnamed protein product [Adineta steineri]CAF3680696.1 unnamed protein product [Adineta steineri]